jgi:hypothetical protein
LRKDYAFISRGESIMRKPTIIAFILAGTLLHAIARKNIQEGEEAGIPDRADVEKQMKLPAKKKQNDKKEVRQNQESTDPVFYDSTTSPKEMEDKKSSGY